MMMMRNLRPNQPTVINIYLGTSQQSPAPNYLRQVGQTNGEINSHYIGEITDQHTENIIERKTLFLKNAYLRFYYKVYEF